MQINLRQRGQSLVEMAIITPLLLFMLIGVFEVGYLLRNYLILINASREAARFSVRTNYLDFSEDAPERIGYYRVVSHTQASIAGQLDMDFDDTDAIVISHVGVDTGWPCDPEEREEPQGRDQWPNCDCELAATNPYTPAIVIHPGIDPKHAFTYPITSPRASLLDYEALADRLAADNNEFNCRLLKKVEGGVPRDNEFIAVELFYSHHQLFGFPVISNPWVDPITLRATTVMRFNQAGRGDR